MNLNKNLSICIKSVYYLNMEVNNGNKSDSMKKIEKHFLLF